MIIVREWAVATARGKIEPASPWTDGYGHCSSPAQVAGPAPAPRHRRRGAGGPHVGCHSGVRWRMAKGGRGFDESDGQHVAETTPKDVSWSRFASHPVIRSSQHLGTIVGLAEPQPKRLPRGRRTSRQPRNAGTVAWEG